LLITSIFICFFNIYYSFKYTKELENICNNIYKNGGEYKQDCKLFTTEADVNEDNSKYARVDSIFFIFSAVNVKYYRNLYSEISTEKSISFDSTVLNMSEISFFCLILIFILNLVFIYFLFNKANALTYLSFTVSDYTIFLYNLYDVHEKFLNIFKEIEEKRVSNQSIGKIFMKLKNLKIDLVLYPKKEIQKKHNLKNFYKRKYVKGNLVNHLR